MRSSGTLKDGTGRRMSEHLSTLDVPARERLIVALDVDNKDQAVELVKRLGPAVDFYKVGWELLLTDSYMALIKTLTEEYGKKVFADLKIHEIPETVRRAMRQLKGYHPEFVTLHAHEHSAIKAAVEEKNGIKVLAVTVLTSLDQQDLERDGIHKTVEEVVIERARGALALGCDGVITSGLEAPGIRGEFGQGIVVVVPGIRPPDRESDDQKRTVDVEQAFLNGADYIVVGRPIRDAVPSEREAAEKIQERIAAVFA